MATMKPYYETDLGKLYHGDCLSILPRLSNIDVIVTDPPFNVGKDFDNDNLSAKNFMAFCNRFALCLHDLSPLNIIVECGKQDTTMRYEIERYFDFKYTLCLNYTNSMRQGSVGYANFGLIYWFSNKGKCYKRYKDRIDSPLRSTKKDFKHESPKETQHYFKLVEMFSRSEHTICDPFLGSGTTAIVCEKLQRKWIGVESSEKYCEIAVRRIKQEADQLKLFQPCNNRMHRTPESWCL